MDLTQAAEQITKELEEAGQNRNQVPVIRREDASPASIPTPQVREIQRLTNQYSAEAENTRELVGSGTEAIAGMYADSSHAYLTSVVEAAGDLSEIKDPAISQICTKFFVLMTNELGQGLTEHFRLGEARVKGITNRSLEQPKRTPSPPVKPKTLTQVVKDRKLTPGERLRGWTQDVTFEEED